MRKWLMVLGMLACGAPAEEIGSLEEPLSKEKNWGVKQEDRTHCTIGTTGVCYYPYDRVVHYCLDSSWTPLEEQRIEGYLWGVGGVVPTIYDQSGDIGWMYLNKCDGFQDITIRKASVGASSGPAMQGLSAYQEMVCNAIVQMNEYPVQMNGTHTYCTHWNAYLDLDDIVSVWGNGIPWANNVTHVARHALGSFLATASGIGMTDLDNTKWQHSTVTPLGKAGFRSVEYCRQEYASHFFNGLTNISVESAGNFCN